MKGWGNERREGNAIGKGWDGGEYVVPGPTKVGEFQQHGIKSGLN